MVDSMDQGQLLRQVRKALQQEDYPLAIQGLMQAASLARAAKDAAAEGRHLGNLALIYHRLHQPEEALNCFQQALRLARHENDRLTEDGILGNMGNILREMGRHAEAIEHLNQALLIAQEIGDGRGRGIWLSNLGLVHDDLGLFTEAIDAHRESVNVARVMRDQRSLASRLIHLGDSYLASGQSTEAIKCYHEVVALHRALGETQPAAYRTAHIGSVYGELGRTSGTDFEARFYYELARDTYIDALNMAREVDDTAAEGDFLNSLGVVLGNMGDYDQAIQHFEAAYRLFQQIDMLERLPQLEENLTLAHNLRGQAI